MRVFIDSDVVISSLISSKGAAYSLLQQSKIKPIISSVSDKELRAVIKRLGIKPEKLDELIKQRFEVVEISRNLKEIKQRYSKYVTDENDAHIVAGGDNANVKYLISYNLRHFKTDKIKDELDILVMTPALFLQYLRSS